MRVSNSTRENWLSTRTQGIGNDFWIDPNSGQLHIKKRWAMNMIDTVQITYRCGQSAETAVNGTTINSTATTVRVDSTAWWPSSGVAYASTSNATIEAIYYNSLNGTQLLYCSRGQHGTTAQTLNDGDVIWHIPGDINRACILLVAVAIAHNDYLSVNENFGPGMAYEDMTKRIEEWKSESDEILMRRTEVVRI